MINRRVGKVVVRKMQRQGFYLAMPHKGESYVVTNITEYLIAAVRDGIEVVGELD